jgi:uncharacterized protein YjbI with pentapeptide repeats
MVDKKHLDKLGEGVISWNAWRKANPDIKPDLSDTSLFEEILARKLSSAYISIVMPLSAIFSIVFLLLCLYIPTQLKDLPNFREERSPLGFLLAIISVGAAIGLRLFLAKINIFISSFAVANLFPIFNLDATSLDLTGIDLNDADLSNTDLSQVNISGSSLKRANLTNANLTQTKALYSDFQQAVLTGVCLEDWLYNHARLDGVICQSVYLKNTKEGRYPANRDFEPGEFTKVFQEVENTIELIFCDGIDWKAFAFAFDETSTEIYSASGQKLSLRKYEVLDDGLIRLEVLVPPDIDLEKTRADLELRYGHQIARLEGKVESLQNLNDKLLNTLKPGVHVYSPAEKVQVGDSNMTGDTYNVGQSAATGRYARSDNNKFIQSEQKLTLAEAAAEIQRLLKQLEQTNPNVTEAEKVAYVNDETTPSLKRRAVGALQAGGEAAIEEFLDNPYVNVGKAVVKGWMKPE